MDHFQSSPKIRFWGRWVPWGSQLDEVLGNSSTHHADLQTEALENSSVGWKHSKAQAYFGGAKVWHKNVKTYFYMKRHLSSSAN